MSDSTNVRARTPRQLQIEPYISYSTNIRIVYSTKQQILDSKLKSFGM